MIPVTKPNDFAVSEWFRLDNLSATHERYLKTAYTKHMYDGGKRDPELFHDVFLTTVAATALSTANVYGMVFNPESPAYSSLVDELTNDFLKVVANKQAEQDVKRILPKGISLQERRQRTDVYGIDNRAAVRIERMRQEGASDHDIQMERLRAISMRGNLLALTEINRAVNATLETVWGENLVTVTKAKNVRRLRTVADAEKMIVTRKDDRVCNYCEPLDGLTVRIYAEFETRHGVFRWPPFHPRCRCYMTVRY